jgi:hypothetical protein
MSTHAEYRTVSDVAGPLVILDKVKVCIFFSNVLLLSLLQKVSAS